MTDLTDKHAIFGAWAPASCPWSPWVKPVLFAHLPRPILPDRIVAPPTLAWQRALPPDCALVLDLPGATSVTTGLSLLARGFWPMPLFNACPPSILEYGAGAIPAVLVEPILDALVEGVPLLTSTAISAKRAPAFLLDSHRAAANRPVQAHIFDNRSVVFASDFPSATVLRTQGCERALIVHDATLPVGDDLRYALRHWRAGGIGLETITDEGQPLAVRWPARGFWGELSQRCFALFSLRRNRLGGFGAFVPETSGG